MPQHHFPPRPPHQPLNLLMAPHPTIVIPRQPPLRHIILKVLLHMVLIARENPRPAVLHINLQDAQPRRMPRGMMDVQARRNLVVAAVERHPADVEGHVVRQVDARVGTGGDGVEGVFDLQLVHVDGDVGVAEEIEAAGVVEVQMADDYHFYVFDRVPCERDLRV